MAHITEYGFSRITQFVDGGQPITITHLAVGSGTYNNTANTLANEEARVDVSEVKVDEGDNQIVVIGSIPPDVGGFTISEIAILDEDGQTVALSAGTGFEKPGEGDEVLLGFGVTFIIKVARPDAFEVRFPGDRLENQDISPKTINMVEIGGGGPPKTTSINGVGLTATERGGAGGYVGTSELTGAGLGISSTGAGGIYKTHIGSSYLEFNCGADDEYGWRIGIGSRVVGGHNGTTTIPSLCVWVRNNNGGWDNIHDFV